MNHLFSIFVLSYFIHEYFNDGLAKTFQSFFLFTPIQSLKETSRQFEVEKSGLNAACTIINSRLELKAGGPWNPLPVLRSYSYHGEDFVTLSDFQLLNFEDVAFRINGLLSWIPLLQYFSGSV